MKLRWRGLCFLLVLVAACTTPPKAVELGNPDLPAFTQIGRAQTVTVVRPVDNRPDPAIIGTWTDPFGVKKITTATDVAVWAGNAVVSSLDQAGYRVERTESVRAAPSAIAIAVSIIDADVNFLPTFSGYQGDARFVANFQVYKSGKPLFARTFSGNYSTVTQALTQEQYRLLINRALSEALRQAIPVLMNVILREGARS